MDASGNECLARQPRLLGVSILLVEDNDDSREVLAWILEYEGAKVYAVADAAAARATLSARELDVVISDIAMADEDGYSLVRSIRALAPALKSRIYAIALTAYASPEDRVRALDAGFNLHLSKPALPSALIAAIQRR